MDNALFTFQQLNQMLAETEQPAYTGVARSFFTVDSSVAPWAESYTTTTRTSPGMEAEIIGYQSVLPNLLKFNSRKVTAPVVPLGGAVVYTVQDVSNAQQFGLSLDRTALNTINEGIYRKEDRLVFRGDASTGVYGLANHPQVAQTTLAADGNSNGYTATSSWLGKTITQIITEFGEILRLQSEVATTVGAPEVDTFILPTNVRTYLQTTFVNPANPQLTMFDLLTTTFSNIQFTSSVIMNSIPVASQNYASNSVGLLYNRTASLSVVIPRDVTLEPTQASDLRLSTPAHSRFGGIRVFYPESVLLIVGI
jgi:hypothetical protein